LVVYKELEFVEYDKAYQEYLVEIIEKIDSIYREVVRENQDKKEK